MKIAPTEDEKDQNWTQTEDHTDSTTEDLRTNHAQGRTEDQETKSSNKPCTRINENPECENVLCEFWKSGNPKIWKRKN